MVFLLKCSVSLRLRSIFDMADSFATLSCRYRSWLCPNHLDADISCMPHPRDMAIIDEDVSTGDVYDVSDATEVMAILVENGVEAGL